MLAGSEFFFTWFVCHSMHEEVRTTFESQFFHHVGLNWLIRVWQQELLPIQPSPWPSNQGFLGNTKVE